MRIGSGHINALDGLRALAVGMVLLFHGGVSWAHGGYLGVDLFFVLSGYLIAGKLLDEQEHTGTIQLGRFWLGRFRRLLPALLLVLVAISIFAVTVAEPNAQRAIRDDVWASLLYVANWHFIFGDVGYFASSAAPSPARHLWSLAVEEQFYLLFPLLIAGLAILGRRGRRILGPVAALVVISTLWTLVLRNQGVSTTRLYEGTDTRLATILLGVLAALIVRGWSRPPQWLRSAVPAAAVFLIAITGAAHGTDDWMYPGGQLAFALAAAVVIAGAVTLPDTRWNRVLSTAPLVFIGHLSYSLYLWHWPVYLVLTPARTGLDGPLLLAIRVAVSVFFATLSYRLVEQPIRLRRVRVAYPSVLAVASMIAVAGLIAVGTAGAPAGDELAARTEPRVALTPDSITNEQLEPLVVPDGVAVPPAASQDRDLRMALVGDSAAASLDFYAPEFEDLGFRAGTVIGCGVMAPAVPTNAPTLKPDCAEWKTRWAFGLQDDPDVVLMVLGAWEINAHQLDGLDYDPAGINDTDAATTAYLDQQLDAAVDVIQDNTDARIAALELPCSTDQDVGVGQPQPARTDLDIVDWFNSRLHAMADRHPGVVQIISINDKVCPDGDPVEAVDGVQLRDDGTHWTEESAPIAWRWLIPLLQTVAYRPVA